MTDVFEELADGKDGAAEQGRVVGQSIHHHLIGLDSEPLYVLILERCSERSLLGLTPSLLRRHFE